MQQYFDIDSGSGTLTIFHTDEVVSFDVEHYGGFRVKDDELLRFLENDTTEFTVTENLAERYPDLAEKRPELYPNEDNFQGTLTKLSDGQLEVYIDGGQREVTVTLSEPQVETLQESITVGEVERYDDGQYPVESIGRDGSRNRADHD